MTCRYTAKELVRGNPENVKYVFEELVGVDDHGNSLMRSVFHDVKTDQYWAVEYTHSPKWGTSDSDLNIAVPYEVKPVEVTVVEWRKVEP